MRQSNIELCTSEDEIEAKIKPKREVKSAAIDITKDGYLAQLHRMKRSHNRIQGDIQTYTNVIFARCMALYSVLKRDIES